ncbi:MAG: alpha amylase C-terminal domain-containing protein, partial [Candidatus Neomarinimicrobiota bacterium]
VGVPAAGEYEEVFNSDCKDYNGSGVFINNTVKTEEVVWNGRKHSVLIGVPPLACVMFKRKKK